MSVAQVGCLPIVYRTQSFLSNIGGGGTEEYFLEYVGKGCSLLNTLVELYLFFFF